MNTEQLRERFFYAWGQRLVNASPPSVFDWFKPYLQKSETIDREALENIKDYFGEHDKTPFEHWAYTFLNNILKQQK